MTENILTINHKGLNIYNIITDLSTDYLYSKGYELHFAEYKRNDENIKLKVGVSMPNHDIEFDEPLGYDWIMFVDINIIEHTEEHITIEFREVKCIGFEKCYINIPVLMNYISEEVDLYIDLQLDW